MKKSKKIKIELDKISRYGNYSDILTYLIKIIPQNEPYFNLLLSLANYSIVNKGLTQKQIKIVDGYIDNFAKKGMFCDE